MVGKWRRMGASWFRRTNAASGSSFRIWRCGRTSPSATTWPSSSLEPARRRSHELSGGEQQRVALARAIAGSPRVVLLDEPFSSLDAELRATLRRKLADLQRQLGLTTICVTHNVEDASALATRAVVMRDGRIETARSTS